MRCDNRLPRAGTDLRGQEEKLMKRRLIIGPRAALANALVAGLFATAVTAQDVTTDIGTLDQESAEKAFPAKPPYSP